jgi:hypothetical protein
MRPLNPQILKKIVTISMFILFFASTVLFQNCSSVSNNVSPENMPGEQAP